jgi:peroxisomal membrane protein 4
MDRNFVSAALADPKYQPLLALIKGARNGLVYGVKVRFPHALVMTLLFSRAESVAVPQLAILQTFH